MSGVVVFDLAAFRVRYPEFAAVSDALGVDIPEDDYDRLDTLTGAVAYVVEVSPG